MTTDEEKISRLYQQKKSAVPPTQLDNDILKAAHQAVDKPSSVKSPFSGGWPAATSIAAVLIITVILVPLIKQEATTPETKLETLNEQDAIGRSIAEDLNIEATKKAMTQKNVSADIRAKKQSLAKEETRRLTQTLQAREQPSGAMQDQVFATEEAMVPMTMEALSPPQSDKPITTMPSTTIGKSSSNDEVKAETEIQKQSSPMLLTNKVPVSTLTPKLWLEKIQQLIEQGKLDLAQEELSQFKTHYPDEEINQSILNSLKDRL